MVVLTVRSDGRIDQNSWAKPVFNFSRAVPPEPGEAQWRILGQHWGAEHCAGHRLVQWTHKWDRRQTDLKHRTHKRKVKECRHLPSAQDRDPEVADLMPLTAKGHERDTSVLQGLEWCWLWDVRLNSQISAHSEEPFWIHRDRRCTQAPIMAKRLGWC